MGTRSSANRRMGATGGGWRAGRHGPRVVLLGPGPPRGALVARAPSLPPGLSTGPPGAPRRSPRRARGPFPLFALREPWAKSALAARSLGPAATELGAPSCDIRLVAETQGFRAVLAKRTGAAGASSAGSRKAVHRAALGLTCGGSWGQFVRKHCLKAPVFVRRSRGRTPKSALSRSRTRGRCFVVSNGE